MIPQRGIPQRPIPGAVSRPSGVSPGLFPRRPSQSLLSPKGVLGSPFAKPGIPSRVSSLGTKSALGAVRRPASLQTPPSFFGTKRDITKLDLRERIRKVSPYILKGKMFTKQQRVKMIEQWFPYQKFGTHVKEGEAKRALRELRKKESWAKPRDKKPIKYSRKLLEAFTGIKKY